MDDSLEQELRAAGRVDSHGRFGLDPRRAAELLAKFRFASPYEYVLKLVQAALASGATLVEVQVRGGDVSVGWHSPVLRREHVPRLATGSAEERWLAHLAVGLTAARGLRPRRLELVSWVPGDPFRYVEDAAGARVEALEGRPDRFPMQVVLQGLDRPRRRYSGPSWFGGFQALCQCSPPEILQELRCRRDSEATQVWRRCVFAPAPVLLNGALVNNPFFGQPRYRSKWSEGVWDVIPGVTGWEFPRLNFVLAPGWGPGVLAGLRAIPIARSTQGVIDTWAPMSVFLTKPVTAWWQAERFPEDAPRPVPTESRLEHLWLPLRGKMLFRARTHLVEAQGQDECAFRVWGVPAAPCHVVEGYVAPGEGRLILVRDGVVLGTRPGPTRLLGNRVTVCSAASLDLDLSGFAPVENEKWRRLLEALDRLV